MDKVRGGWFRRLFYGGGVMAGSVNKVILVGNLGGDPEIRNTQAGDRIATLSVATSETWKDRASGERREKTEWHRVVVFGDGLAGVAERYLRKGSKVYLEGELRTRKWQGSDGADRWTTEVVLSGFGGKLVLLGDGGVRRDEAPSAAAGAGAGRGAAPLGLTSGQAPGLDDDIPF